MLNKLTLICISALLLGLGGCSWFTPYTMDIRQGNYVTPEMRKKVRIGMSRQQLTAVLGSPLVSDVFHANRWDYIYRLEVNGKLTERQRLTVFFDGDFVQRIEDGQAGVTPAQGSSATDAAAANIKPAEVVPVAPAK